MVQAFKRFPNLREKFYTCVNNYFKKAVNPTNKLVTDLIAYATVDHLMLII